LSTTRACNREDGPLLLTGKYFERRALNARAALF
jgi:hypothetical protein